MGVILLKLSLPFQELWPKMDLQEAWDPTSPPYYKAEVRGSARSIESIDEANQIQSHSIGAGAANIAPPPTTPPTPPPPRGRTGSQPYRGRRGGYTQIHGVSLHLL